MKPIIKKQWIKALLSGKYKQGKNYLNKGVKFCCLGVLSDLYAKEHNVKWEDKEGSNGKLLFNEADVLPSKVMRWAGLFRKNPMIKLTEKVAKKMNYYKNTKEDLATLNDNGCNFKVIAECIKQSL